MAADLSRVVLIGRLVRDPELKHTGGGTDLCRIRLAYTTRRKQGEVWEDKSNYIDVTVFGGQASRAAEHLSKGRAIAVDGRLEFDEWTNSAGEKRSAHHVIAEAIRFIGPKPNGGQDRPPDAGAGETDDDIPF